MSGGPERRAAQSLTADDVKALFGLMSQVVYGGGGKEDLAFSGQTLASWFDAYGEHLLKLMAEWPDLSRALQSEDARRRARVLHERLRRMAADKPLVDVRGRSVPHVQDTPGQDVRSLILGKGMEI
jgi:hypothetical protein